MARSHAAGDVVHAALLRRSTVLTERIERLIVDLLTSVCRPSGGSRRP